MIFSTQSKTVNHLMTRDNFEFHVNERLYPSITLKQFEHSQPKLPSSSDAALHCILSIARGSYHLFYAVVIGLPTDWLTFKTHVFLLTWNQVKFDAYDAYAHALTISEPLRGAYLQQENLFLREAQLAPKTQLEKRAESVLPLPKKPIPTPPPPPPLPSSMIPPPPPPPMSPSLLASLNNPQLKKTGAVKVPPKKPSPSAKLPASNDGDHKDFSHLPLKERMKAMQSQIVIGKPAELGASNPPPKKKFTVQMDPPSLPKPVITPPLIPSGDLKDPTDVPLAERMKAMRARLAKDGLGTMEGLPKKDVGTPAPKKDRPVASGSFVPQKPKDTWKGGKIDTGKFGKIAAMLENRTQ